MGSGQCSNAGHNDGTCQLYKADATGGAQLPASGAHPGRCPRDPRPAREEGRPESAGRHGKAGEGACAWRRFLMGSVESFGLAVLVAALTGIAAVLSSRVSERLRIPAPAFFLIGAAAASDIWPRLGCLGFAAVEQVVTVALAVIRRTRVGAMARASTASSGGSALLVRPWTPSPPGPLDRPIPRRPGRQAR